MIPKLTFAGLALVFALAGSSFAQTEFGGEMPLNQFFIGAGAASIDNIQTEDVAYNFYAGKFWEVNSLLAFKALAEATTDFNEAVVASGDIGLNFYPVETAFAPYIGGVAGVGYARDETTLDAFGMNLGAQLGLQLFRTSNLQVHLETKASTLLNDIADNTPVVYSARIGVLF